VGGTIVALVLIGSWIKQKKLNLVGALIGTAIVSVVAWKIVIFSPEEGIIARYPSFFLPVLAALAFALVVSVRRLSRSAPVAYTAGTLGALIGADLMHVSDMQAHFAAVGSENTIISIGGAGVFDMVFLAGTFAMALDLLIVVAFASRRGANAEMIRLETYPGPPVAVEDAPRVLRAYPKIENPHALDRALAGIAMSDQAIRERDYSRSVRMSWLAVDSILKAEEVAKYVGNGVHPGLRRDVETLRAQYVEVRGAEVGSSTPATLQQAGNANVAAKTLVGALARKTTLRPTLEGVTGVTT
jgi:hypothetical protein